MKQLALECDLVLVVGSPNSSNSNRLCELAGRIGTESYLIDAAADINPAWLQGKKAVGITAGASAPENLVLDVVKRLQQLGAQAPVELDGTVETVHFTMPKELR